MTEPGSRSRPTPDGGTSPRAVAADPTVSDPPARTDGEVDTPAEGRDERAPGVSLGGSLAVEPPQGGGSSARDGRDRESVPVREREPSRSRDATVLHVDDDPGIGDLVVDFLEEAVEGATVVTETDAAAALDTVARGDVDCVVSDLEMPGMDGLALARALEATHPDVPVVLFTSRDWRAVAGRQGTEAVAAHVHKSVGHRPFETLARRVRALLD